MDYYLGGFDRGTGVIGTCPSTYGGGYGGNIRAKRQAPCYTDNDCAGSLICCPFPGFSECVLPQY